MLYNDGKCFILFEMSYDHSKKLTYVYFSENFEIQAVPGSPSILLVLRTGN